MEFNDKQQKYIDNLIIEKTKELKAQVEELEKFKPVEKTEQELAIENKEKELWQKEKMLILKENKLDKFADFINAENSEDLQKKY